MDAVRLIFTKIGVSPKFFKIVFVISKTVWCSCEFIGYCLLAWYSIKIGAYKNMIVNSEIKIFRQSLIISDLNICRIRTYFSEFINPLGKMFNRLLYLIFNFFFISFTLFDIFGIRIGSNNSDLKAMFNFCSDNFIFCISEWF